MASRRLSGAWSRDGAGRRRPGNRYLPHPMIIVLVLVWALLGLAVFFIAMRGGPRGARQALHTESRAGQRVVMLGVAILIAFGIAVPALVLAANGSHKASAGVGGVHLTASEQRGRDLFAHACAVCHTLEGAKA